MRFLFHSFVCLFVCLLTTSWGKYSQVPSNVDTIPTVLVSYHGINGLDGQNAALNETVSTEAFTSPKSELITSSPHINPNRSGRIIERDATVINVST